MPVEIKELHIRIVVNKPANNSSASGASTTASAGGDKTAIVAECVEQVLQILKQKAER